VSRAVASKYVHTPQGVFELRYFFSEAVQGPSGGGTPLLLLTVQGRKSGLWKRTALICGEENGSYLVVASMGGAPKHPVWYLNLQANPEVRLQVKDKTFAAIARTATAEEKPALWEKMVAIYPDYADYQLKTDREIPIVILDPVPAAVA
jgi:deazaflavin-dependent oxidoreductase (nitroreductase family)